MRFYLSLIGTSIRASMSLRLAFWIEMALMVGNNLIFFLIWWIFFNTFETVGEWGFDDVLVMMAIVRMGYGGSRVLFGGNKLLAQRIVSGGLDTFMTQPKNLLIYLLGSRSQSKGWGHIVSALILFTLAGVNFSQLALSLFGSVCACLIFASSATMAHSLCFWFGNIGEVSKRYVDSVFLFVHYPVNIYTGVMQLLMFTLFPAGVIAYLPVELVKEFSWTLVGYMVLASLVFTSLAFFMFYRGLRRYESGNLFLT